jgi:hypothetical protein
MGTGEAAGSDSNRFCSLTALSFARDAVYAPRAGGAYRRRLSAGRKSSQATRGAVE